MTRLLRTHASVAIVAVMLGAGAVIDGAGQSQARPVIPYPVPPGKAGAATPSLVGWNDLETWTRQVGLAPDTELGLGLHLTGPEGMVQISFAVTRLRDTPNAPPQHVAVALVPRFDPSRVRWSSLTFVVTGPAKKQTTIDASSRVATYPPGPFGPGDSPVNAVATMTADEFTQIAGAVDLKVVALGVNATLRADQVKALLTFADQIRLAPARRRR